MKEYYSKEKYRTESRPHPAPKDLAQAVDMINRAERPVIVAGHGVFFHKAWEPLMVAAEKNEIAVVTSGPMRGHFPDEHRLSASLSPDAFMSADLVVFVGQYSMPTKTERWRFHPDAKAIRVNPTGEDLGRNWPLDLGIVADEGAFLEGLASDLPQKKRDAWVGELAAARQKYEKRLLDEYEQGVKHSAGHQHAASRGGLQGSSRFSVQGQHRSEADRHGLGRLDHRQLPARDGCARIGRDRK